VTLSIKTTMSIETGASFGHSMSTERYGPAERNASTQHSTPAGQALSVRPETTSEDAPWIGPDTAIRRVYVISLAGEVDYGSAQQLRAALMTALAAEPSSIVVDLGGVTFLDSTGIGTLVVANRICADMDIQLHIRAANPFIARLFCVVGVADVLGVPAPAGLTPQRTPRQRAGAAPQLAF
jgi:anti-sigma B factor antagonist